MKWLKSQKNKILQSLRKINVASMGFDLLILSTGVSGIIKSSEWINSAPTKFQSVTPFYRNINQMIDLQTVGWFLLISSLLLLSSVFIRTPNEHRLMIIGGLSSGIIYFIYGILAVDQATLYTTYYNNLINGWVQILIAGMGAISLWKTKK